MALKVRKNRSKTTPPTCALTECMRLLGGAWTPNVVWHLSGGPRRFGELRADIPRVSAKVLSERLRVLENKGVLTRTEMSTSPPSVEYELTSLGAELIPVIEAIVRVGHQLKARAPEPPKLARERPAARSSRVD